MLITAAHICCHLGFFLQIKSFDFVVACSVFTHLLPRDLTRYLMEITRVLKPGGTFFASYFLLNRKTLQRVETRKSTLDFTLTGNTHRTVSDEVPERAIAHLEEYVQTLYEQNRLAIMLIRYGTWSVHPTDFEYQDFIVARKISR